MKTVKIKKLNFIIIAFTQNFPNCEEENKDKLEKFSDKLISNLNFDENGKHKDNEILSFLKIVDPKDFEVRKKEFEEILKYIEGEFDIEIYEKIEDSLEKKKYQKEETEIKKAKEENKEELSIEEKSKEFQFNKFISIRKITFNKEDLNEDLYENDDLLKANKKQIPEKINNLDEDYKEEMKKYNLKPLNKDQTNIKLCNIEKKIINYLSFFQKENFFKKIIFTKFINEENSLNLSRKKITQPSIIKCFFEEEAVLLSAKKRHSVAGDDLKNKLEKMNQQRNCVSNKNEDEFIMKQKALARKRSNISDFSIGENEKSNNFSSDEDEENSDEENFDNIKNFELIGNGGCGFSIGKRSSSGNGNSTANSTPKLRLSKRGSILRDRMSKLNMNLMVVKEEENNINVCNSDLESIDNSDNGNCSENNDSDEDKKKEEGYKANKNQKK